MPKYKNLNEGLIDKFINKIFGGIAKRQAKSVVKKISKQDPKLGKQLAHAQKLAADTRKYLNSLPKDKRDEFEAEWEAL
jgi:hypothetical protein